MELAVFVIITLVIILNKNPLGPRIPCPPKSNLTTDCADSEGEGTGVQHQGLGWAGLRLGKVLLQKQ